MALLALLAPEFIFVWALRQWLRARSLAIECQEAADDECMKAWSAQLHTDFDELVSRTASSRRALWRSREERGHEDERQNTIGEPIIAESQTSTVTDEPPKNVPYAETELGTGPTEGELPETGDNDTNDSFPLVRKATHSIYDY